MFLLSINASTETLNSISCSVTMELITVTGLAQFVLDPTVLNSNLSPVKAKGDVLFLSVLSRRISGIFPITFNFKSVFSLGDNFPFETFSKSSKTCFKCFPIKIDNMAEGASCIPIRRSLLAETDEALKSASCFNTAAIVLTKKVRNCKLLMGVFPGLNKLTPLFVFNDQLLCLPEPLIFSKGFS